MSVLTKPRSMVRRGNYYGPEPRKLSSYKPELDSFLRTDDDKAAPSPSYQIFT